MPTIIEREAPNKDSNDIITAPRDDSTLRKAHACKKKQMQVHTTPKYRTGNQPALFVKACKSCSVVKYSIIAIMVATENSVNTKVVYSTRFDTSPTTTICPANIIADSKEKESPR